MKHKREIFLLNLMIVVIGFVVALTCLGVIAVGNWTAIVAEVVIIIPGYVFLVRFIKKYIKELQDDEETRYEP